MSNTRKYIFLGAGHGINDCIAGFIIGSLFYQGHTPLQLGIYTLLYNLLAFGGQLVFARIYRSHFFPKKYLAGSFVLLALSLAFLDSAPSLAILFSGIASAIVHITGGTESTREDDKSFGIGIFASPGIIGLIAGGYLSYIHANFIIPGIILCLAYLALIIKFYKPSAQYQKTNDHGAAIEQHDVIMVILITIISLRSFIWDVVQMVQQQNYQWLIVIAISAMCGKIAGGFISDKIGHKRYTLYALLLALPLLTLLKKSLVALSVGVFLLQSTIPATTVMVIHLVRSKPAFAISISFGVSVLVAITLFYTPAVNYLNNNLSTVIAIFISVVLLRWVKQKSPQGRGS